MGKFLAALIVVCALAAGAGIYYMQVYGYYEEVAAQGDDVVLTRVDGTVDTIPFDGFEAIDANSSPIRYRACFTTSEPQEDLAATYQPYPRAEPLTAPRWFDCFDASEVGEALQQGEAKAFLSVANVVYGIDRIAAVMSDGRGFVWHQINACGEVVFDGRTAPDGCPPPPDS
ncbi:MAG: histidine kinase [Pseudooceanicola sp.]|nr:histidine kinase [Pseudooceanicola sp.]